MPALHTDPCAPNNYPVYCAEIEPSFCACVFFLYIYIYIYIYIFFGGVARRSHGVVVVKEEGGEGGRGVMAVAVAVARERGWRERKWVRG